MSETLLTLSNPLVGERRPGSVGLPLPGVEATVAQPDEHGIGELMVRGPSLFRGYWGRPEASAAAWNEGWFSTGDIAEADGENYWYITGRKKELIVSSNGKKIYPSRIENLFKMEPLVNQVVLIGDKKPYMTAILTLNLANLKGPKPAATAEQVKADPVTKAVEQAVARVNNQLADFERIRRFRILDRDFSIEHGELTPTMKIRRARVLDIHKDLVSQLYLGREESE